MDSSRPIDRWENPCELIVCSRLWSNDEVVVGLWIARGPLIDGSVCVS